MTILKVDCGSAWDVQVPSCSHEVGLDAAETPYTFEIANQRLSELLPLKAKGNIHNYNMFVHSASVL